VNTSPIGEWEIVKSDFIGTKEDLLNGDKSMNLYTFFGASIWAQAEGKSFVFKEDGTWNSDLIPKEVADILELKYEWEKNIIIYVNSKVDSTSYEFIVDVVDLNNESMVWKFGNYMNVYLKKK
jgi:hypothetical protein